HDVTLHPSGEATWNGKRYSSLRLAGLAIMAPRKALIPWREFRVLVDGEVKAADVLREKPQGYPATSKGTSGSGRPTRGNGSGGAPSRLTGQLHKAMKRVAQLQRDYDAACKGAAEAAAAAGQACEGCGAHGEGASLRMVSDRRDVLGR